MKEMVTEHAEWCSSKDNSQVLWDIESNVSECRECGAVTTERDTDTEQQMTPEVSDGHTP